MKISDIDLSKTLLSVQQTTPSKAANPRELQGNGKTSSPEGDRVDLSIRSKELKKIEEVLALAPDVRTERVEALKRSIEEGRYEVDSAALAERMIRDALFETNR